MVFSTCIALSVDLSGCSTLMSDKSVKLGIIANYVDWLVHQ